MTPASRASAKSSVTVASGAMARSTEECEMSRSCQSTTFSSAGVTALRTSRARPSEVFGEHGVALVRHRRRPLLPLGEIFLRLQHFAALQVTDLGGEPFDRRRDDRRARQKTPRGGRAESPGSRSARR